MGNSVSGHLSPARVPAGSGQPTDPSISSIAYSIGSSRAIGSTKPRTSVGSADRVHEQRIALDRGLGVGCAFLHLDQAAVGGPAACPGHGFGDDRR